MKAVEFYNQLKNTYQTKQQLPDDVEKIINDSENISLSKQLIVNIVLLALSLKNKLLEKNKLNNAIKISEIKQEKVSQKKIKIRKTEDVKSEYILDFTRNLKTTGVKIATLLVYFPDISNKIKAAMILGIDEFETVNDVIMYLTDSGKLTKKIKNLQLSDDQQYKEQIVFNLLRVADILKDATLAKVACLIDTDLYISRILKVDLYKNTQPFIPLINEYLFGCIAKYDQVKEKENCLNRLEVNKEATIKQIIEAINMKKETKIANKSKKFSDDVMYECYVSNLNYPNKLQIMSTKKDGDEITLLMYKGCVFDVASHSKYPNLSKMSWSERLNILDIPTIKLTELSGEILNNKKVNGMVCISYLENGYYNMKFKKYTQKE